MKKIYFVSLTAISTYPSIENKSWFGFEFEKDLSDDIVRKIADKVMSVEDFCNDFNNCRIPSVDDYYCRAI